MTNYLSASDACRHAWIDFKQMKMVEGTKEEIAFIAGYNAAIQQMYVVLELADSRQKVERGEWTAVS